MRCPICNKVMTDAMREARPFCSVRCKQVDLGKWLNNEYSIPGSEQESTEIELQLPQRKDEE